MLGVFVGKRRYVRKQSGYGGQTKPIFHKKVWDSVAAYNNHNSGMTIVEVVLYSIQNMNERKG